uniref:Uncharacterized protein n=1 Tax=Bactrocera latifrons TaxID=174628 RepID=A0A0K8UC70_BACLA
MSGTELKKCDYDSLASKSKSYINEDEMEIKQQFKRKHKTESGSSAEDARIFSDCTASPLKTRFKSDTEEDKTTIQEFTDIRSITGKSPELGTIESHGKEVCYSANIKEKGFAIEKAMTEFKEHAQTQRISLSKEFTGTLHNFAIISPPYSFSEEFTRELESKCFSRRNEQRTTGMIYQAQTQHGLTVGFPRCSLSEKLPSKCFSRRNEERTTGIIYQAQTQHDLAVISPRSSLSDELTKELEFSNARSKLLTEISSNRTTENKYQAEDLAVISPQSCLSEELRKEMERRISSQTQEKEMKSQQLTKKLELHIAKNKLLTGVSRKRDIGIKSQAADSVVISPRSSLSEELTKKMELRIAKRALKKEMKAASIKPNINQPNNIHQDRYSPYETAKQIRRKSSNVSLPTTSEGESFDQKVRRSLRSLFLSQIQREQANLIAIVMLELKECLAKRNAAFTF